MKRRLSFIVFVILTIRLYGLDFGYNFVKLPKSPYESIFGYGLVSFEDDAFASINNPAVVPSVRYAFSGTSYLADVKYGTLAGQFREMTIGLMFINSGEMAKFDENGMNLGSFSANFIDLKVGKSVFSQKGIRFGASIGLLYQGIDGDAAVTLAADIGAQYRPLGGLTVGAALRNLGFEVKSFGNDKFLPPILLDLGATYKVSSGFLVSGGLEFCADYPIAVSLGTKFSLMRYLDLAVGFNSKGKDWRMGKEKDILAGLNFGFSVHVSKFDLSYSFTPMGSIGNIHRIAVAMR